MNNKQPNYTEAMEKRLSDFVGKVDVFDYEAAKVIAAELGKKPKSIIAKSKRMGLNYTPKPAYVPKVGGVVEKKTDIVDNIATILGTDLSRFEGLAKSDKQSLLKLREDLQTFNANFAEKKNESKVYANFIDQKELTDEFVEFIEHFANDVTEE